MGGQLPQGAVDDGKKTVITGWRGQAVFDVSQTQGTPLLVPRGGADSVVDAAELWSSLEAVASSHGFKLTSRHAQYGLTSGFTDFAEHRVQVGAWLSPEERTASSHTSSDMCSSTDLMTSWGGSTAAVPTTADWPR
jgi:hypothetical protein